HAVFLQRRHLTDSVWKRLTFKVNPLHRTLLTMEKQTYEYSGLQVIFTNSHMVKQEILSTYHVPQEKIEVVHNGVEWKEWEAPFKNTFEKPRTGPFQFLFVGNGYKRKGLFFLLQGLAQMSNQDFQLTVIGKEKNPAYFQH